MKRVINHMPILQYLRTLKPPEQKNLILNAPKELILTLSEICLNLIQRNIVLSSSQILKLRKFEKVIVSLSEKKHSLANRKRLIRGGGFLKNLLDSTVPPLIYHLARKKRVTSKRKHD